MGKRSDAVAVLKPTKFVSALIVAVIASCVGLGSASVRAQDADPESAPKVDVPKPAKPAAAKPAAKPATTPAKPAPAAAAPAPAAPAASDATAAPQEDPNQPILWVKLCSKDPKDPDQKTVCLTAYELRDDKGQVVASVALREIDGDTKKTMLIAVPPLMLIQPGLRISVDKGKQDEGKYTICFPNACYAEVPASDTLIQQMKKGTGLYIVTLNTQGKPITFPIRLYGFKEKNEGPGIDPTQAARQSDDQDKLQQELQKRADEAAKTLGAKPTSSTPAPVPADPAPKP
jgi:invasion protein IalB